jgi:restriction system protein
MSKYWVIAPYSSDFPEIWEKVWQYDLSTGVISLGWSELGDISSLNEDELKAKIECTYSDSSSASNALTFSMLWNFYHSIRIGDIVIARRGRKRIAAVGDVTKTAYYDQAKNAEAVSGEGFHSNYIGVDWRNTPRDIEFDRIIFGMQAFHEISESKFKDLISDSETKGELADVENQTEFVLEKYLEEFIVSNFPQIFNGKLVLYKDPHENVVGQQYGTDVGDIDILAQEPDTNSLVVIELKKGRESDKVVGQILRYMGWVSEHLCSNGQSVKGMIICRDQDMKLSYALKTVNNISINYYRVDFTLSDTPFKKL